MADIFDGETKTGNSPANTETPGSVAELVGEGKKFATVEDLAKGKQEADQFIEQLKGEMSDLRSDLDQRLSAQDLLEEIRKEREAQLSASNVPAEGNTTPSLGTDEIASLVKETIEQRDVERTASQNLETVDKKMKELYGEKAQEVMLLKAKENDISPDFLKDTAAKSPKAFFNVLGIQDQKPITPSSTKGGINLVALDETQPSIREDSWQSFEKLRKDNPKLYWKPETQQRLFRAKQEQGDAFGN